MRFVATNPPGDIAGHVQEFWLLEDDGQLHAGLPKPYIELVFSLAGIHWWRATRNGREHRYDEAWITPLQSGPRYARSTGRRHLIGARLQPWSAIALFGPLPHGNGTPPPRFDSIVGEESGKLRQRLIEAPDDERRFESFANWLREWIGERKSASPSWAKPPVGTCATTLARQLESNPRSLRRRFARDFGVSPKQWLKLHRLDAVLRESVLGEHPQTLAEVALEHGYCDQSHLSREVSSMTGATPGELRSRPGGLPPHLLPKP